MEQKELYDSFLKLIENNVPLSEEQNKLLDEIENETFEKEIFPNLTEEISSAFSEIKRPLKLVVLYDPNKPVIMKLTRDEVVTDEKFTTVYPKVQETIIPIIHNKHGRKTNLMVTFPNGTIIKNQFAYQTLIETIECIGEEQVANLHLKCNYEQLISLNKQQARGLKQTKKGWWVITHSGTKVKKEFLDEISEKLGIGLKVEIIK
jgi:hypothetical protein